MPLLLRSRIPSNVPVEIVGSQEESIHRIWPKLKPGDRFIVIADEVDEALQSLRSLTQTKASLAADDAICESPLVPIELLGRSKNDKAGDYIY